MKSLRFLILSLILAFAGALRAQSLGQVMRALQERYEVSRAGIKGPDTVTSDTQLQWGGGLDAYPTDAQVDALDEASLGKVFEKINDGLAWCASNYTVCECKEYYAPILYIEDPRFGFNDNGNYLGRQTDFSGSKVINREYAIKRAANIIKCFKGVLKPVYHVSVQWKFTSSGMDPVVSGADYESRDDFGATRVHYWDHRNIPGRDDLSIVESCYINLKTTHKGVLCIYGVMWANPSSILSPNFETNHMLTLRRQVNISGSSPPIRIEPTDGSLGSYDLNADGDFGQKTVGGEFAFVYYPEFEHKLEINEKWDASGMRFGPTPDFQGFAVDESLGAVDCPGFGKFDFCPSMLGDQYPYTWSFPYRDGFSAANFYRSLDQAFFPAGYGWKSTNATTFWGSNGVTVVRLDIKNWNFKYPDVSGVASIDQYLTPSGATLAVYSAAQLGNPSDYSTVTGTPFATYEITSGSTYTDPVKTTKVTIADTQTGDSLKATYTLNGQTYEYTGNIDFTSKSAGSGGDIKSSYSSKSKACILDGRTLYTATGNPKSGLRRTLSSALFDESLVLTSQEGLGYSIKTESGKVIAGNDWLRGPVGKAAANVLKKTAVATGPVSTRPASSPPDVFIGQVLLPPQGATFDTTLGGGSPLPKTTYKSKGDGYSFTSEGTESMREEFTNDGRTGKRLYAHRDGTATIVTDEVISQGYRRTITAGVPDNPSNPTAILHGTSTVVNYGPFGFVKTSVTTALGDAGSGAVASYKASGDAVGRIMNWNDVITGINLGYAYDKKGNVIQSTAADGMATTYSYDALGRLTKRTAPDGSVTTRTYSGAYSVTENVQSGGGVTTTLVTDALGNLLSSNVSGSVPSVSVTVARDTSGGGDWLRTTTTAGKTLREPMTWDGTVLRAYGNSGSGIRGVTYNYSVGNAPGAGWGYDCVVARVSPEDDSGAPIGALATTSYTDAYGRLRVVRAPGPDGSPKNTVYAYGARDNVGSVTTQGESLPYVYTYDNADRVLTATHGKEKTRYTYVVAGGKSTVETYVDTDNGEKLIDRSIVNRSEKSVTSMPYGEASLAVVSTVNPAARTNTLKSMALGFSKTSVMNADRLGGTSNTTTPLGTISSTSTASGLFGPVNSATSFAGVLSTTTVTPVPSQSGVTVSSSTFGRTSSASFFPDSVSATAANGDTFSAVRNNAARTTTVSGSAIPGYSVTEATGQSGVQSTLLTDRGSGAVATTWNDGYNAVSTKRYVDNTGPTSSYNAAARKLTTALASGNSLETTYDEYGAVTSVVERGLGGTSVIIGRDKLSRVKNLADLSGSRTFAYNDRGAMTSVVNAGGPLPGAMTSYGYDGTPLRRPVSVTVSNLPSGTPGFTTNLTYVGTADSRIASVSGLGLTATYTYETASGAANTRLKRVSINRGGSNLSLADRGFDGLGRLAALTTTGGGGSMGIAGRSHAFGSGSNADRRVTSTLSDEGTEWNYTYDSKGALTLAVLKSGATTVPGRYFSYNYDALGNRTGSNGALRGGSDYAVAETTNDLNATATLTEPGLIAADGLIASSATLSAYSWSPAEPVVIAGTWDASHTAAAGSDGFAEYSVVLPAGAWRPSLNWPTGGTPANAVLVTVSLPGQPDTAITMNSGQQPGTALALSGYKAFAGGRARVRLSAAPGTSGRLALPVLVWERKVTSEWPAVTPVTVSPTAPVVAAAVDSSHITVAVGRYRVLLPAESGVTGWFAKRLLVRSTLENPTTHVVTRADRLGDFEGVGGLVTMARDADGNLTADVRRTHLDWTPSGRLVGVTMADGSRVADTHDAEGRRVRRVRYAAGGAVRSDMRTLWDGWTPLVETEYDATGALLHTRRYLWGLDLDGSDGGMGHVGGLLAVEYDGHAYVPCYDASGHVIGLIDGLNGALVARYEYGPFGEPLRETGPAKDACPFRWNTRYWDADTQLYYFGYRHYDPLTGRWLSREPLGEGAALNLYAYCGGDPVNKFDYLGLDALNVRAVQPYQVRFAIIDLGYDIKAEEAALARTEAEAYGRIGNLGFWGRIGLMDALPDLRAGTARRISMLNDRIEFLRKIEAIHKKIGYDGYGNARALDTVVEAFPWYSGKEVDDVYDKYFLSENEKPLKPLRLLFGATEEDLSYSIDLTTTLLMSGLPALSSGGTSEVFYRTMSQAHYDELVATGRLPATAETFISPSLDYARQYEGVTVQFNLQKGTTDSLLKIGVKGPGLSGPMYDGLPMVKRGWASSNAFFKMEGGVINTGLGNGTALDVFNTGIETFHLP